MSNTPCPHTSCKVHWCWWWNFQKCIIRGKLYQLCPMNNKYRYMKQYVISFLSAILELSCETALSWKPFRMGHMYIYTFLLRITETMSSKNIDLSSWDTLYSQVDYFKQISDLNIFLQLWLKSQCKLYRDSLHSHSNSQKLMRGTGFINYEVQNSPFKSHPNREKSVFYSLLNIKYKWVLIKCAGTVHHCTKYTHKNKIHCVNWIHLTQEICKWLKIMNTDITIQIP
jgi:hypothetical protein